MASGRKCYRICDAMVFVPFVLGFCVVSWVIGYRLEVKGTYIIRLPLIINAMIGHDETYLLVKIFVIVVHT